MKTTTPTKPSMIRIQVPCPNSHHCILCLVALALQTSTWKNGEDSVHLGKPSAAQVSAFQVKEGDIANLLRTQRCRVSCRTPYVLTTVPANCRSLLSASATFTVGTLKPGSGRASDASTVPQVRQQQESEEGGWTPTCSTLE